MFVEYSVFEKLIVTCLSFLGKVLDLLPTLCEGLPIVDKLTAGLDWFLSLLVTISIVLPVEDIVLISVCVIGISGFGVAFNIINWVVKRVFDIIP